MVEKKVAWSVELMADCLVALLVEMLVASKVGQMVVRLVEKWGRQKVDLLVVMMAVQLVV